MDERKRTFDGADMQINTAVKRLRPEEILGGRDEPGKAVTRLLLNRAQFSRVIGKGGQTITHVRSATGVYMKGSDIDEENRLVLLTGGVDQVLGAFDIITDFLHQAILADFAGQPVRPGGMDLSVHLLLEHSKAGRVVGQKGAMMQNIKHKSGATQIKMEKDPMDVGGIPLRKLTIEGPMPAVRRAHMLILELFVDPNVAGGYNAYGGMVDPMAAGSPIGQIRVDQPTVHMVPVPFPNLVNYGVQAETVRQLTEMKAYLWRHFSLDLSISREVVAPPGMVPGTPMNRSNEGVYYGPNPALPPSPQNKGNRPTIESIIESRRASNPSEVCFSIPRMAVGAIIGKGGQKLRDLQAQFGVRVYIEKEDFNGKRMVVLSYGGETPMDPSLVDTALQECRDHIEALVEEQLKQRSDGNPDGLLVE